MADAQASPTVLVAIVTGVSAVAVATVTGLFGWLSARAAVRRDPEDYARVLKALAELEPHERRRNGSNGPTGSGQETGSAPSGP